MKDKYPISYLFTMVAELLHELGLPHEVKDVITFGHDREEAPDGAVFVEVITRDASGARNGTERIVRWIERDISYADWGKAPTEYTRL